MIEGSDITYLAGNLPLISDVSVTFAPGQLHLIIGPNGAGKSTLIKVLARLITPHEGVVKYAGEDIRHHTDLDLARRRAVLSQAVEVAFPLTVRELVMMGRYPHFGGRARAVDEKITDEVMDFFDVTEFYDRDYQTLSGGERQRVNFARVLAQVWKSVGDGQSDANMAGTGCRYLFLDEPLTFLDIRHQIEFMKKVQSFTAEPDVVTVGVVHDLNLAARFADQIVLMDSGRVVAAGKPADVLTSDRISEVFGVKPRFVPGPDLHLIFD